MNAEQYKRASNNCFYINAAVIVSGMLLTLFSIVTKSSSVSKIAVILIGILCTSFSALGNYKYPTVPKGSLLIMGGSILFYLAMILSKDGISGFSLALPILISCITFLDVSLCRICIAGVSVSFIISCIRFYMTSGSDDISIILSAVSLILACAAAYRASCLLSAFHDENNEIISLNAEKSLKAENSVSVISDAITGLFNSSKDSVDDLVDIIDTQKNSMKDIAGNIEAAARTISVHSKKIQGIQIQTIATEQQRKEMDIAVKDARQAVDEGNLVIDSIRNESQELARCSSETVNATKTLISKVEEVQKIVESILSISKQTNLLALNASIEAARAGEAGKGFAVVANDVRDLATQTNTASSAISDIISDLTAGIQKAISGIDDTAKCVASQSEMIDKAGSCIEDINSSVGAMLLRYAEIDSGMRLIIESAGDIGDGISTLSDTSKEIAALSYQVVQNSANATDKFNEFKSVLDEMSFQASRLNNV